MRYKKEPFLVYGAVVGERHDYGWRKVNGIPLTIEGLNCHAVKGAWWEITYDGIGAVFVVGKTLNEAKANAAKRADTVYELLEKNERFKRDKVLTEAAYDYARSHDWPAEILESTIEENYQILTVHTKKGERA